MKKEFGHNERFLVIVCALIFAAMFTLPVCAWELWTTIDERNAARDAACCRGEHVCEWCHSEVHD